MMATRRAVMLLAGLAVGGCFLWIALRSMDMTQTVDAVRQARWAPFVVALALAILFVVVKALRWRYLIHPLTDVPARDLIPAVFAGNAGNIVIPHAGELLRVMLVSQRFNVSRAALVTTVGLERAFDCLAVLVLTAAVFLGGHRLPPDLILASYVLAAACLIALGAALLLIFSNRNLQANSRGLAWLPESLAIRILQAVRRATLSLQFVRSRTLLGAVLLLSVLQWLTLVGCVAFSLAAVGVQTDLVASASALILCVAGLMLPSAPGYVGTTQLAFALALPFFDIGSTPALAGSLLYNFAVVVPTLLIGLVCWRVSVKVPRTSPASSVP
jgi:glycosyltransferase 2 family protein